MSKIARDLNIKNIEERVFELEKNPGGGGITEVPLATDEAVGGFKTGNGVSLDENGNLVLPAPEPYYYYLPVASENTLGGIKTSSDKEVEVDSNDVLKVNIPVSTSDTYADYNTNSKTPLQKFLRKFFPYKKANSADYIGKVYRENVNNEGTLKTKLGPSHEAEFALTNTVDTLILTATPYKSVDTGNTQITFDYTSCSFDQNLKDLGSSHTNNNFDNTYPRVFSDTGPYMRLDRTNIRFILKPYGLDVTDPSTLSNTYVDIIFSRVDYNKTQKKIVSSAGIFIDGIKDALKTVSYNANIDPTDLTSLSYPFRLTNSLMTKDYQGDNFSNLYPSIYTYTDGDGENHIQIEQRVRFFLNNTDIEYELNHNMILVKNSVRIEIDAFVNRDISRDNYYFIPMSEKVPVTPTE